MLISSQQWSIPQGIHSHLTLILNLFETKKKKKYWGLCEGTGWHTTENAL